jgi:oxysterol-binding protein-related protein 8
LWSKLTAAILEKNMDAATEAKTAVEESQREVRRQREESSEPHVTRFFLQNKDGRWIPKFMYVTLLSDVLGSSTK